MNTPSKFIKSLIIIAILIVVAYVACMCVQEAAVKTDKVEPVATQYVAVEPTIIPVEPVSEVEDAEISGERAIADR